MKKSLPIEIEEAVRAGDLRALGQQLRGGPALISARTKDGESLLHLAAASSGAGVEDV